MRLYSYECTVVGQLGSVFRGPLNIGLRWHPQVFSSALLLFKAVLCISVLFSLLLKGTTPI